MKASLHPCPWYTVYVVSRVKPIILFVYVVLWKCSCFSIACLSRCNIWQVSIIFSISWTTCEIPQRYRNCSCM